TTALAAPPSPAPSVSRPTASTASRSSPPAARGCCASRSRAERLFTTRWEAFHRVAGSSRSEAERKHTDTPPGVPPGSRGYGLRRDGRPDDVLEEDAAPPETLSAADIGGELGERATLVHFSTAFCQPCRATRRVLADVAAMVPG